jgi:DNA-binding Xre family transcriptional regulator
MTTEITTMPTPPNEPPSNVFTLLMQSAAKDQNIGPYELSAMIALAYETVRKIWNGEEFASKRAVERICEALGLDYEVMRSANILAKAYHKNGGKLK